jgi:Xaa-Pro aminopeptidase
VWDGRRAGVEGAQQEYGADAAFPIAEFEEKLADMMSSATNLYYRIGNGNSELDDIIINRIRRLRAMGRKGMSAPQAIIDTGAILHEMRLIKNADELELMQRAADIAAEAHIEAMKTARPGMKEYEIEALLEYHFRRNGAAAPAYTSIVGTGANATVLHYVSNDATLKDGDLLLIDAGAEYRGYASDITRTFPVNGRFTPAQRDIYELVLEAQMACVEMVRPGVTNDEIKQRSIEIQTEGMVRLGLLHGDPEKLIEEEKYKQFYMHGLGHYLGMDVHDVGRYYHKEEARKLEPGMVMTVEPGIYIAANAEGVPEKYLGIGVRIEDDVLVTENGPRVLSSKAPKHVEEIEALTAR